MSSLTSVNCRLNPAFQTENAFSLMLKGTIGRKVFDIMIRENNCLSGRSVAASIVHHKRDPMISSRSRYLLHKAIKNYLVCPSNIKVAEHQSSLSRNSKYSREMWTLSSIDYSDRSLTSDRSSSCSRKS